MSRHIKSEGRINSNTNLDERKSLKLLAAAILLIFFVSLAPVKAHGGVALGPASTSTAPSIDGVLQAGEWSSAASQTFTMGTASATIYVMNDATNLYIAVEIHDDDTDPYDALYVLFDNDNGGGALVLGDDVLSMYYDGFADAFVVPYPENPPTYAIVWDSNIWHPEAGGTQDGSGSRTQDGLVWYYEFSHPLNSGDSAHDFALQVGSTVGFEVGWFDWNGDPEVNPPHYYFLLSSGDDPNKYGDIAIAAPASPATTGPVGGVVEPVNRLAVFAPYLALPALVAAVAVVVAAPWKKHER